MIVERMKKEIDVTELRNGDCFLYKGHVCLKVDADIYECEIFSNYPVSFVDLETNELNGIDYNHGKVQIVKAKIAIVDDFDSNIIVE